MAMPFTLHGGRPTFTLMALLAAASFGAPAWAVNKCTGADGKVSFQDAPCTHSEKSERIQPATQGGLSPSANPSTDSKTPAPAPTLPLVVLPQPPAMNQPVRSPRELEADLCLNWYRPLLRDPAGAYYSEVLKEQRVLTIKIHATNGFGGYVVRDAACEIHNGRLNESWTRIHAERGGWVSR